MSDYGVGIQKILIVFIAVPVSNTIHEEYFLYIKEEQHLEIAIRLDYKSILEADSETCMLIMKQSLLDRLSSNCEIYSESFDWRKFIDAIAQL